MATYGTDNAYGVPVTVEFSYNGTSTPWGTANLYSMAPLSNRAESVDGSYEISDLSVELIDTNGSIWGTLGNGTGAFNKEFSATVYIGGTMAYSSYGPSSGQKWKLQNTGGAATYTVHQGKIVEVSKRNRLVQLKSQNNLRSLGDLEWRFPYTKYLLNGGNYTSCTPSRVGSYLLYSQNLATFFPDSVTNLNEEGDRFDVWAACATVTSAVELPTSYPSIAGRGTLGLKVNAGVVQYAFPGTQFYTDYPVAQFDGTWIGTYIGTIKTDEDAARYGFANVAAAQANRVADAGTRYIVNKTRLNVRNGTLPVGTYLYLQQNMVLDSTPATLFREMVAGHCVTEYFGTSVIDSSSYATTARNTVYQNFIQRIDPNGGKVLPYLKDLFTSVYGLFAANTRNQFEFRAYGPRNLQQTIGTLDGTDLVSVGVFNEIKNAVNRVVIEYDHSPSSGGYQKKAELKSPNWSGTSDVPLVLQTKWMRSSTEAAVLAQRLLSRFRNTVPSFELEVPLKFAGINLGSLYQVTDAESGLSGKTVEIVGYSKDFTDDRRIVFQAVDGDVVYNRKGFGFWMAGTNALSGNVSGTSTLGWGTSGTMANINTSIYGSQFVWW